jgi:hypothetical protein
MKVEAIKMKDGFLIPFSKRFKKITQDRIFLEIKILDQAKIEERYSILDEMVGFCESNITDASINHDSIIYKPKSRQ